MSAVQQNQPRRYRRNRDVGKFAIFFHTITDDHPPLAGTEKDADNLQNAADSLGFDVDEPHCNLKCAELLRKLDEYAEMVHTNSSCFAVAITGHGGYNGTTHNDTLVASDGKEYNLSMVLNKFRGGNCPSLKGKPKLFFIDACRGPMKGQSAPRMSSGSGPVVEDSTVRVLTDPDEADFLIVHATYPGYEATTDINVGSIFTNNLCKVLLGYKDLHDIVDILTLVSNNVAAESCDRGKPQMPSFTSKLTASLHLRDSSDAQPPRTELFYKMENPRRGHFYIFSNERDDDDVELLHETGNKFVFDVKPRGLNEMMDTAIEYVNEGHTDHDCLVCVIKTCSKEHDILYVGDNQTLHLKDFIELFHANQCPAMHGKPKIFIVQAPYKTVKKGGPLTSSPVRRRIPETADTLIVYSTSPEFTGSDRKKVSLIKEMCRHLQPNPEGLDLFKVFTLVAEQMSVPGVKVPTVISQLRNKVIFK